MENKKYAKHRYNVKKNNNRKKLLKEKWSVKRLVFIKEKQREEHKKYWH